MSRVQEILNLSHLRSPHIAEQLGLSGRYVRKVLRNNGKSHRRGPPDQEANPSWMGGRMIDLDGYVLLSTKPRRISEHREIMEKTLGRPLSKTEVVDHIDGITIHNDPNNLRVFSSNAEHLAKTATGVRFWSEAGLMNIGKRTDLGAKIRCVSTYDLRKKRGDVRLRAILRCALELGIDNQYLLGTRHWLTKIGIDPFSRSSLERAWDDLSRRFEADLVR